MEDTIEGDSYDTPDGIKRYASEYLMLGSRWSPYSKFFEVMFQSRRLALRGLYDDEAWARSSIEILRRLERCGAKLHISGLDNVRALNRPAVFISNHMSTFETLLLPGIINPIRPCTYVVKEKLLNGLIWGPIMRSRDPISVTRTDARKDLEAVLQGGAERLAKGRSIIIFPQGTRTDAFSRAGFNSLGVKLASRAGVPVVPVAVKTDYWGNSPLFRGFGPVRRDRPVMMQFAPAMAVSGRGKAEHEAVLDFIEGRLREWGGQMADKDSSDAV